MPRIAPRPALIGTLLYMITVAVALVVPAGSPHIHRGFLRDFELGPRLVTDAAFNVAVFIPIGWGLRRAAARWCAASTSMLITVVAAAAFSLTMEALQFWLPNRYSSLADVAANTLGATVGAWIEGRFRHRA